MPIISALFRILNEFISSLSLSFYYFWLARPSNHLFFISYIDDSKSNPLNASLQPLTIKTILISDLPIVVPATHFLSVIILHNFSFFTHSLNIHLFPSLILLLSIATIIRFSIGLLFPFNVFHVCLVFLHALLAVFQSFGSVLLNYLLTYCIKILDFILGSLT